MVAVVVVVPEEEHVGPTPDALHAVGRPYRRKERKIWSSIYNNVKFGHYFIVKQSAYRQVFPRRDHPGNGPGSERIGSLPVMEAKAIQSYKRGAFLIQRMRIPGKLLGPYRTWCISGGNSSPTTKVRYNQTFGDGAAWLVLISMMTCVISSTNLPSL